MHSLDILEPLLKGTLNFFDIGVQTLLSQVLVDDLPTSDLVIRRLHRAVLTIAVAIIVNKGALALVALPVHIVWREFDVSFFKHELRVVFGPVLKEVKSAVAA